jgi:hypothetical protein
MQFYSAVCKPEGNQRDKGMRKDHRERLHNALELTLGRPPTLQEYSFHSDPEANHTVVSLNLLPALPLTGEFAGEPRESKGDAIDAAALAGIAAIEDHGFALDDARGIVQAGPSPGEGGLLSCARPPL